LFVKTIRKLTKSIQEILKLDAGRSLPTEAQVSASNLLTAVGTTSNARASGTATKETNRDVIVKELEDEGNEVLKQLRDEQRQVLDSLDLKQ
jgi:N-acetyltransferase 10